jgi:hypothetical protein
MGSDLDQTAWGRAKQDAAAAYRSTEFRVGATLVTVAASAVVAAFFLADPDTSTWERIWFPILAAVLALIFCYGLVLVAQSIAAPYRQRSEAREVARSLELQQAQADPQFAAIEAQKEQQRLERDESLRRAVNQVKEDHYDFRKKTRVALAYGDDWQGQAWVRAQIPSGQEYVGLLASRRGLEDLQRPVQRMYQLAQEARYRATTMVGVGSSPLPPGEKHTDLLEELAAALDEAEPLLDRAFELAEK